ncbi:nuclear transport factor 2 family protein [Kordia zhangzhouensis]|uniref:nuclear transport factor 2 family protein n=1 Tax=Kordia zhangzhouensis TaxID=1620405 RepID=UPI000629CA52|nr:nuclear transport factor 2 family protein [Kordia zhangzhouensis]
MKLKHLFLLAIVICATSCISIRTKSKRVDDPKEVYVPVNQQLYTTIMNLDKQFFDAYNSCDLETQDKLISEDLEFYHDKGGLATSKAQIMEAMKNNICGKVTRTLIEGSVEVYPIEGYGAVQIGEHKFFNNQEPTAISIPSKFVTIWKNDNGNWQMTRIISTHKS